MAYKLRPDASGFWAKWIDPMTYRNDKVIYSIIVTSEAQRDWLIVELIFKKSDAAIWHEDRASDRGRSLPSSVSYVRWIASDSLDGSKDYRVSKDDGTSGSGSSIKIQTRGFNQVFDEVISTGGIPLAGMNPTANIWTGSDKPGKPKGQAIMVPLKIEPIIITKTITSHVIQTKTAGQGLWSRSATVSKSTISGSSLAAAGGPLSHTKGPIPGKV